MRFFAKSLEGNWRAEHIFSLQQAVELYDFYTNQIIECESRIQQHRESFEDRSNGAPFGKPSRNPRKSAQKLNFAARRYLY